MSQHSDGLEQRIDMFDRALTQHRAAETHWTEVGDPVQVDLARWRQNFALDRIVELRGELAGALATERAGERPN